jgi:N-acetylglucosaminyl-diphospho-decaprenol L-rhamnosyltransferase
MQHTFAILINYHNSDLTLRCIESLDGQVFHIVIVDNSADRNEFAKLQSRITRAADHIPSAKCECITSNKNLGFSKGIQYGLDYINAKYSYDAILIINNDAIAHAGMVDHLQKMFLAHEKQAIVAPEATIGSTPTMMWYNRLFGMIHDKPKPFSFPFLTGACLLIPPSLTVPSLFDQSFFMYGEDVELAWRLKKAGIPCLICPEATYEHEGCASAPKGNRFNEYHMVCSHFLLASKLTENKVLQYLFLSGRLIFFFMRALVRAFRQRSYVPLSAYLDVLRGKPC